MKKVRILFIISIILLLTCIDDSGTSNQPTTVTIKLNIPYHQQTYLQTCQAVCAWMYIEYQGNRLGFYKTLPADPELDFYYYLLNNGWLQWDYVSGSFSKGVNHLMWDYTFTNTQDYTIMNLGTNASFDNFLLQQTQKIDVNEPSIVLSNFNSGNGETHVIMMTGYEKDKTTNAITKIHYHDPLIGGKDSFKTRNDWNTFTLNTDTLGQQARMFVTKRN